MIIKNEIRNKFNIKKNLYKKKPIIFKYVLKIKN